MFRPTLALLGAAAVALSAATVFVLRTPNGTSKDSAKPPPAGKANAPIQEERLNTVSLSDEAAKSLGLQTAKVQREPTTRQRIYGGEISVPDGQSVLVASPMQGILKLGEVGAPVAGAAVRQGQVLYHLWPLLTPEAHTTLAASRVDAEGLVATTRTQLDAAKIALDRAERLLREGAGSQRLLDEARAAHEVALKAWQAAQSRVQILTKALTETSSGTAQPIAIRAPRDGLLRLVSAQSDQNVPAGAPLFEIVDLNHVWVRVAVSVGDMDQIDSQADATVGNLTAQPGDITMVAKPATAPPSADPLTATVNLFYDLDNRQAKFLPGQRVAAELRLRGQQQALCIPWSAVVHDIHGGSWIYEPVGDRQFVRKRVVVDHVVDGKAVLAAGPAEGAHVVTEGAIELFGVETGFSK